MEVMVSNELTGNLSPPPHFAQFYSSVPSTPSRIPHFYSDFDCFLTLNRPQSSASSSFQKADDNTEDGDDDFAFFVSQDSDAASLTADELFDGGKIRTLKADQFTSLTKRPLASNRDDQGVDHVLSIREPPEERRGRDTTPAVLLPSNSGRRGTRSLSPCRVSQHTWDEEHEQRRAQAQHQHQGASEECSSSSKGSRRWKLRDLLLFRSASEGQGSSKDPLRKYSALYNKKPEDAKFSKDSPTGSLRRGTISPHEFHYAVKKAESQDLKKKTFLPYKQGILGRLAGLGSHTR